MTAAELRTELASVWRYYSTWVVLIVTGVAQYWLSLPIAEQAALLAEYPVLKHVVPLLGVVAFVAARVKAQPGLDGK